MGDFKEDSLYPQYAICKKHKTQKWKKNTAELNVWLTRLLEIFRKPVFKKFYNI